MTAGGRGTPQLREYPKCGSCCSMRLPAAPPALAGRGETGVGSDWHGENYIFVVAPKADLEGDLDWLVPVSRQAALTDSAALVEDDLACFFSESDGNSTG